MTLPTTSMRAPLTQATMDDLIRRGLASPDARQGREAAFAAFAEAEMPRLERTDLSKVHLDDFHVVVEAGDIPADIREAMRGTMLQWHYHRHTPEEHERVFQLHAAITSALKAGDPVAAADAMTDHFVNAIAHLRESGSAAPPDSST